MGSASPLSVGAGNYSTPNTSDPTLRTGQAVCLPGQYCLGGIMYPCPAGRYGTTSASTSSVSAQCPTFDQDHWCDFGSNARSSVCFDRASCCHVVVLYGGCCVVQNCDGACTQGYYCPAGSTVANVSVCGNLTVVCPAGSGAPTVVSPGYYSVGGASNATMVAQLPCPAGSYCVAGQQNICPVGRYGNVNTGSSTVCNNTCPDGYQW